MPPHQQMCLEYLHMKMMSKREREHKFDGNYLEYPSFCNEFTQFMNRCHDDAFRFDHLLASVTEDAREVIDHCRELLNDPTHALHTALSCLTRNFGAPHLVRQAHLKNLTDSTKAVHWNQSSLRKLLNDLLRTQTLLKDSAHQVYLDLPDNILAIASRLPGRTRDKFVNKCNKLPDPNNPGFRFLVEFVKGELKLASGAMTPLLSINSYRERTPYKEKPALPHQHFLRSNSAYQEFPSHGPAVKNQCCCCKKHELHRLKECEKFLEMSIVSRQSFVNEQPNLCPACFGTHSLTTCKSRFKCQGCGSDEHNTLLCPQTSTNATQSDNPPESDTDFKQSVSFSTLGKQHPVYVRVVPLKASANGKSIDLYALLDSGSDTTLLTRNVAKRLKLKGKPFHLRLQGVTSSKDMKAEEVSISIQGIHPECDKHQLDKITCVPYLPNHSGSLPSSNITECHPHLHDIEFPLISKEGIDLIIGADFESLHHVLESRTSPSSSLCAHRTPLGWVLSGPDDKSQLSSSQVASASISHHIHSSCVAKFH